MKKNTAGSIYVVSGIISIVFAIIIKNVANDASHSKTSIYFLGHYIGRSSWSEIYDTLFVLFLIVGIVLFIAGIAVLNIKEQINPNDNDNVPVSKKPCFIECPNCGELNGSNNTQCFKCRTKLDYNTTKGSVHTGEWVCKKCGKINSSYVGTCGCGEVKPK